MKHTIKPKTTPAGACFAVRYLGTQGAGQRREDFLYVGG